MQKHQNRRKTQKKRGGNPKKKRDQKPAKKDTDLTDLKIYLNQVRTSHPRQLMLSK